MIRQATIEDIHMIIPMCEDFAKELDMWEGVDKKAAAELLTKCLDAGLLFVGERKDKIVGVAAGLITKSLWNPAHLIAEEQIYYVKPEARGSTVGYRLIKRYIDEVYWKNADISLLKLMFNSPDIQKHYARHGYKKLESTYFRRM